MKFLIKSLFFIPFFITLQVSGEELDLTVSEKTSLGADIQLASEAKTSDKEKTLRENISGLTAIWPLKKRLDSESWLKFSDMDLSLRYQRNEISTSVLGRSLVVNSYSLVVSDAALLSNGEILFLRGGATAHQETRGEKENVLQASGMATYKINEDTRLIYGAFYGQIVDGRNLLLPILGATFKSGAEWKYLFLLPITLRATYVKSKQVSVDFFLKSASERFKFKNDMDFSGRGEALTYRNSRVKIGIGLNDTFDQNWALKCEGGFFSKQKIYWADGDNEFSDEDYQASVYAQASLFYLF